MSIWIHYSPACKAATKLRTTRQILCQYYRAFQLQVNVKLQVTEYMSRLFDLVLYRSYLPRETQSHWVFFFSVAYLNTQSYAFWPRFWYQKLQSYYQPHSKWPYPTPDVLYWTFWRCSSTILSSRFRSGLEGSPASRPQTEICANLGLIQPSLGLIKVQTVLFGQKQYKLAILK